jgi:hypothetical protein
MAGPWPCWAGALGDVDVSRGRVGAGALAVAGALHATLVPQYETASVLLGAVTTVAVLVALGTAWANWQEPTAAGSVVATVIGATLATAAVAARHGPLAAAPGRSSLRDGLAAVAALVVVALAADDLRRRANGHRPSRVGPGTALPHRRARRRAGPTGAPEHRRARRRAGPTGAPEHGRGAARI